MLKPSNLPPPETLIEYPDGSVTPLMFHYASEAENSKAVLDEQGFEARTLYLESDADNEALNKEYEDGAEDVIGRWHPKVPDGWMFGGKNDTEDGLVAWFLRRKAGEGDDGK